jgi:hypothetical protein
MCDRKHCPLDDKYDFAPEDKNFIDKIRKHLVVKLVHGYNISGFTYLEVKLLYKDAAGEEYEITSDHIDEL